MLDHIKTGEIFEKFQGMIKEMKVIRIWQLLRAVYSKNQKLKFYMENLSKQKKVKKFEKQSLSSIDYYTDVVQIKARLFQKLNI